MTDTTTTLMALYLPLGALVLSLIEIARARRGAAGRPTFGMAMYVILLWPIALVMLGAIALVRDER